MPAKFFRNAQRVIHTHPRYGEQKATVEGVFAGKTGVEYTVRWQLDDSVHSATADVLTAAVEPRQRDYDERKIASGARRLPSIILSPEGNEALQALLGRGYSNSIKGAVEKALIEASIRVK